MRRIILTMLCADNVQRLYVLPTDDYSQITQMIEKYGLTDHKLINWKIEDITIIFNS